MRARTGLLFGAVGAWAAGVLAGATAGPARSGALHPRIAHVTPAPAATATTRRTAVPGPPPDLFFFAREGRAVTRRL
jgi:hypothetical protein